MGTRRYHRAKVQEFNSQELDVADWTEKVPVAQASFQTDVRRANDKHARTLALHQLQVPSA